MAVSPSSKNNVTFIRMPCEEKSQPLSHTDWELTTKALACTKRILITHSYISCLSYSTDDIN